MVGLNYFFFFFQAEDGIRDIVTGVQTCALPIFLGDLKFEETAGTYTPAPHGAPDARRLAIGHQTRDHGSAGADPRPVRCRAPDPAQLCRRLDRKSVV